ncbi:MAG: exonuclease SbcCD subunit D [Hyphomicrobiaceae bacterium]
MSFAFVHTADWQIGKPFGRFEAGKAAILRRARDEAIDRVAQAARAAGAANVLVAGDVFDGEALPDQHVRQTLRRFATAADLTWHLLPGNHDPARPGGIWERVQTAAAPPANVRLHLTAGVTEIAAGVQLLVAPLHAKSTSSDPTAWMDQAATPVGHLRIGMAHGSVQGFGSLGEAAVPIDPARARKAGLAYLALGDWHGVKEIGPATWYSGTPEPDSFTDNHPGHVLAVRLDGPTAAPMVMTVRTAAYRWLGRQIETSHTADLGRLQQELARAPEAVNHWLLDLTLSGRLAPAEMAEIDRRLVTLADGLFDLRVDRQLLRLSAGADDIASLGEGAARIVATRLEQQSRSTDATEARRAARALELLFALDAEMATTAGETS